MHPTPSSDWADFTIMMECTAENGPCHSVYSVGYTHDHSHNYVSLISSIMKVHFENPMFIKDWQYIW